MARSMAQRARDPFWWLEQGLHALLGAVFALPAIWGSLPVLTGACAALLIAGWREWGQRPVESWGDWAADIAFTVAGGAAAGAGAAFM